MTEPRRTGTGEARASSGRMSEAEFRSLYDVLRSRRPWGPDDRRGALNYLTSTGTLAGAGEVSLGRAVSLAAPVEGQVTPDNPEPAQHRMKGQPAREAGGGLAFGLDRIEMNIHGNADSHLDALSHVIFDGELYNGVPADPSPRARPSCPSRWPPTGSSAAGSCSTYRGLAGWPGWSPATT